MHMPSADELSAWIVKLTFKAVFLGVTVLFIGKICVLFVTTFQVKRDALIAYLNSSQAVTDLGQLLWKIIKEAVKGGTTF